MMLSSRANALCGDEGIVIFGAYWCPACKLAENFLSRRGIPYDFIETTGRYGVQSLMAERFGTTAIPVVIVDQDYKIGYDPIWLKRSLCLAE
jgi:glutaredoxin